jgi:hypothetical protein
MHEYSHVTSSRSNINDIEIWKLRRQWKSNTPILPPVTIHQFSNELKMWYFAYNSDWKKYVLSISQVLCRNSMVAIKWSEIHSSILRWLQATHTLMTSIYERLIGKTVHLWACRQGWRWIWYISSINILFYINNHFTG